MTTNTPYTHKLQQALINAGKSVERSQEEMTPILPELDVMYNNFREAVDGDDLMSQVKAVDKLTAALIKWKIEILEYG